MGGEGSGRKPDVLKKMFEQQRAQPQTPIMSGNITGDLFLPNYAGIKEGAKKTSSVSFLQAGDNVSLLTNDAGYVTTVASENWLAVSGSYQKLVDDNWLAVSGSYLTTETDPIFIATSGSFLKSYTETDPIFIATSGSFLQSYTETDPIFIATSGSFLQSYTETDPIWISTSGSYTTLAYTEILSGAYVAHAADSSDPHGANLTQTGYVSMASGSITADWTTSGAARLHNVVLGTNATPPTASGFVQGTIYIQYTP